MTTIVAGEMPSSNVPGRSVDSAVPVGLLGVASTTSLVRGRDRSGDGIEIEGVIGGERRGDRRAGHQLGVDGVDLERPPWVDDLVARVDVGQEELLQQTDRAGADRDLLDVDAEPVRRAVRERRWPGDRHSGWRRQRQWRRRRRSTGSGGSGFSFDASLMALVMPCSASAWAAPLPGR